jgi:hypothetical protein
MHLSVCLNIISTRYTSTSISTLPNTAFAIVTHSRFCPRYQYHVLHMSRIKIVLYFSLPIIIYCNFKCSKIKGYEGHYNTFYYLSLFIIIKKYFCMVDISWTLTTKAEVLFVLMHYNQHIHRTS